ncbi:FAD-dependent oxidoreductase [Flavobacterium sp.]|uniref:NAD(P)/FAD-dependent oxidoreductase n=1 Tax=Flavobacterium sp. TaxID=239 RepID=UPI002603201B|nr:FAD-dependent oxidoreductase [Flavobacterium sp.]MDD3004976.1 FAD-dependent oxidoreductase [Flavobacterium sp.]
MIDFLIVGGGIAGLCFAETCIQNNKSFLVLSDDSQNSSRIAGGLYNPVVLKRFTSTEDALLQIDYLDEFYTIIENRLQIQINFPLPLLRKFFSIEEQNNWFQAADQPLLSPFLKTTLIHNNIPFIESKFNYGQVLRTGYLDTSLFLDTYQNYLLKLDLFKKETFDYARLIVEKEHVAYNNIQAKNIIFAEGFGVHSNPFFSYLPLDGTKGELFVIRAPKLKLTEIINTSIFILPLGDDLFRVGATYNWKDKTDIPTQEGRDELIFRIKEILQCDFEIVSHLAGVRPTVKDRKPLLGNHENHKNIYVLNGLGTRGVLLGPYCCKLLFEYIENNKEIPLHYSIKRLKKK